MNPNDNPAEYQRERSAPLRVLVASGDSVGHLSHAAVLLDALGQRHTIVSAVVLPRNARFRGWIEGRGHSVMPVGVGLGTHREFSATDLIRHGPALAWTTLRGVCEGVAAIDRFQPDIVVGTGGRCSFAPMVAAVLRGLPTVTVPHYAVRRANRLLARMVDRTCLARRVDVEGFPPHVRPSLRVTGTPLRPEAFLPACRVDACRSLGLDPERPVVGLIGYSGGSPGTTRLFVEAGRRIRRDRPEVQLVVQYGGHPPSRADAGALEQSGVLRPFFDELPSVLASCDAVVSAAGETTLLELCARGIPAVCVSVPDTPIGPHISVLAEDLCRAGAAMYIRADRVSAESVGVHVARLLADPALRSRMSDAARATVDPSTANAIVGVIEELLRQPGPGPAHAMLERREGQACLSPRGALRPNGCCTR
jgi:UDP-N-acetylglucosamine--N-acetylmuramyl-(pentapeptide) pyrophosphoryl-undecaprenol N-acetylglucosamine transferase